MYNQPPSAFPVDQLPNPRYLSLPFRLLSLRKLLLRLLVPVLDQLVEETARFPLGPTVLLRFGELFFEVLLGFFVGFFVAVVVGWEGGC